MATKPPQNEDGGMGKTLLKWAFIIGGLVAIYLLAALSTPMKKLNCDENAPHSLTSFGTCTAE